MHSKHRFLASILACFIVLGCPPATSLMLGTASSAIATQKKPNIVWITSEDNGISWVGCYGGANAKTPTIDMLAKEGFRYTHCFDNAAVCAPTRSCWITGMYGISNGTQPMRSRNMVPHHEIKYYPDLLVIRLPDLCASLSILVFNRPASITLNSRRMKEASFTLILPPRGLNDRAGTRPEGLNLPGRAVRIRT